MTGGSLGIRSGSYGSLDKQQFQNVVSPIQSARKPPKMFKDKERLFPWICKFAGRKVGMLFLCVISAAVFFWVLYVGKGFFLISLSLALSLPLEDEIVQSRLMRLGWCFFFFLQFLFGY